MANKNFADAFSALNEVSPKSKKGTDGIYNRQNLPEFFEAIGKSYNPLDGKKNRQVLRGWLRRQIENFSAIKSDAEKKSFAIKFLAVAKIIYKDSRQMVSGNAGDEWSASVNDFSSKVHKLAANEK